MKAQRLLAQRPRRRAVRLERAVECAAGFVALQVVEPDLGLPPFTVSFHWHRQAQNDPGHRWLREVVTGLQFSPVPAAPRRGRR